MHTTMQHQNANLVTDHTWQNLWITKGAGIWSYMLIPTLQKAHN